MAMSFLRIRSHRSEWKAARKARKGLGREVDEALARVDQEQRQRWVDASRIPQQVVPVTEPWTDEQYARLLRVLEEEGDFGDLA